MTRRNHLFVITAVALVTAVITAGDGRGAWLWITVEALCLLLAWRGSNLALRVALCDAAFNAVIMGLSGTVIPGVFWIAMTVTLVLLSVVEQDLRVQGRTPGREVSR